MNKIDVSSVIRNDARVRPSDAGRNFGKYLIDENLLDAPLECDVRDVHITILISAFFINFMEGLHTSGGVEAIKLALKNIKWIARYDFQNSNIARWLSRYREKFIGDEPKFTNSLSLPDRLMVCDKVKEEIMRKFRMSPIWNAIKEHITKSDNEECGFVDKYDGLVHHRGMVAFSLKKIYAYPPGADDPWNSIRFSFDVSCWDKEHEREVHASVMLDVPLQLVIDFDQELFDEWAAEKNKERIVMNLERAREKLTALLEKHPQLRSEISDTVTDEVEESDFDIGGEG